MSTHLEFARIGCAWTAPQSPVDALRNPAVELPRWTTRTPTSLAPSCAVLIALSAARQTIQTSHTSIRQSCCGRNEEGRSSLNVKLER